jgi:hypothetical protein
MTLSMGQAGQLGGFLKVGPHYFPPRPEGAQVIMRGPHGQRLAADPVHTRAGRVRGSGFRFWSEQLNVRPDMKWNPQQVVTGVMGLGTLPAGWSCPYTRSQLEVEINKAESAIQVAKSASDLEAVRAHVERLRECHMQLGGSAYASHQTRINSVASLVLLKKGKVTSRLVDPRTGAFRPQTQEEYCRRNPSACKFDRSPCPPGLQPVCDAGDWLKENWKLVAVAGIGLVMAYPFLKGAGSGFAAKRL